MAKIFRDANQQEPGEGINLFEKAVMKSYFDDKASNTNSEYSIEEPGAQSIPDVGEVILETEGDLRES